ncbi:MAG TPA: thiamine biosynthesis protein ThiS [Vibrio sp.]|uniref:sulfur carrier protein ThiS n=1 Tax=Vibrio TaxID=662 RepID=UPI00040DB8C0|nr:MULTISPECIES: sulfur carrier protein ThiS [Vibrio]MCF7355722.1 sulfur carrier protein ThiS [Vibrio sp. CK2-1]HCH00614.1 thiamine biosynthesis protein ThiS [Vibrio sp.]
MQVTVNQQVHILEKNQYNLIQLLSLLSLNQQGIAIAINQDVVPKTQWTETTLNDGDDVSVFTMIAGG